MSDQKKYHASIEIKDAVSFFLRRMKEIRSYVEISEESDLISKFNDVEKNCKDILTLASKVASSEKPSERIVENPDRGIADFLSSDCDCNGCGDGGCGGGGCGGGGCGGCGNP